MDLALATEITELASGKWFTDIRLVALIQWRIGRSWPAQESRGWQAEVTNQEARKVIRYLKKAQAEIEAMKAPPKPRIQSHKREEADYREARSREIAEQARTFDPLKVGG